MVVDGLALRWWLCLEKVLVDWFGVSAIGLLMLLYRILQTAVTVVIGHLLRSKQSIILPIILFLVIEVVRLLFWLLVGRAITILARLIAEEQLLLFLDFIQKRNLILLARNMLLGLLEAVHTLLVLLQVVIKAVKLGLEVAK